MTSLFSGTLQQYALSGTKVIAILFAMSGFITPSYAAPPEAPVMAADVDENNDQILHFFWSPVQGADYYRLMVNRAGTRSFRQVGGNTTNISILHNAEKESLEDQYRIEACNRDGCTPSEELTGSEIRTGEQNFRHELEDLLM